MGNGTDKYVEAVMFYGKLFDCFNEKLFGGELLKPVITIQADEKNSVCGWFTVNRVWNWKDDSSVCPENDKQNSNCDVAERKDYEINLSAQFLNRPIKEVAATLLHEMCHYYAKLKNFRDCTRYGVYHNKLFKVIAEKHGLVTTYFDSIGYSYTELSLETENLLVEFLKETPEVKIYREPIVKGTRIKSLSVRKYVCPVCGQSVKATKRVNVICADCNECMTEKI